MSLNGVPKPVIILPPPMPPRSRARYLEAIASLDVEHAPKYRARDLDGSGNQSTFCNLFLSDCTKLLGCPIPWKLATDQAGWLDSAAGLSSGWHEIVASGEATAGAQAAIHADIGYPTVAVWANHAGHGHVAIVCPAIPQGSGLHVAAAGAQNFQNAPISRSFGAIQPRFFTHS